MAENVEITITDVARLSGVSVSTVSRILNGKPDVASATRERVLQVIEQLGYEPHAAAQRLAAGQSRTIALLDPAKPSGAHAIDQLHLDFMIGAATAAGEENYFFNVITNSTREVNITNLYRRSLVDGVILMEIYLDDPRVRLLRSNGFPFVMIGRCADNSGMSYVELDYEAAVAQAFEHLAGLGHRRIAFIGFAHELRQSGFGPAVRAWAGFQGAVKRHGLQPLFRESEYSRPDMCEATLSLLAEQPDLTAVVAPTDAPVAGVMSALRQSGREIPRDVSVVGLAIDRIAELMTPALTGASFPSYEMGYRAAKMLIRQLEGQADGQEQVLIAPEFRVRASTGKA